MGTGELIYRLRYAWHFWRRTRFSLRSCWDAATAFAMEDMLDYSPRDSVDEELSYWADDGD